MSRFIIPILLAAALNACAPERGENDNGRNGVPPGFELAMADQAPQLTSAAKAASIPSVLNVTPAELSARLEAGEIRLIDIRRDDEVANGMIPGAEHIALSEFDPENLALEGSKQVVLYCRSGRRTRIAGKALSQFSGEPAQHLEGGIIAWQEAGYTLERP